MTSLVLHKISDSTGETLDVVVRACLGQFSHVKVEEKSWTMVSNKEAVHDVLEAIRAQPGFVIFTVVDDVLSEQVTNGCKKLKVPCNDMLNQVVGSTS